MAYAGQTLEGVMGLYESMGIQLKRPTLFCDNSAAVCITQGSNDWRTKALVNKGLGLRSLVELGILEISFKSTLEMVADILYEVYEEGSDSEMSQSDWVRGPPGGVQAP